MFNTRWCNSVYVGAVGLRWLRCVLDVVRPAACGIGSIGSMCYSVRSALGVRVIEPLPDIGQTFRLAA
eukprot:8891713-Alexandrium_andersonii.AAC.1